MAELKSLIFENYFASLNKKSPIVSGSKMHPIVNDFINTRDSLYNIITRHQDKSSLLEDVFLRILQEKIVGYDQSLLQKLDQAILLGHQDTNLYLLFISAAIKFTCVRKQLEKSNAIYSIGASISRENIHPLAEAHFKQSLATLRFFELKIDECNNIIKDSMSTIDKNSPRYIALLTLYASLASLQGRLKEFDKSDLEALETFSNQYWSHYRIGIILTNCLWTGDFKEGFVLHEEFKKTFVDDGTTEIQVQKNILQLLSGDFDENNYSDQLAKLYVTALSSIKAGDYEKSKNCHQLLQKIERTTLIDFPFEEYLPLHIELSLKNKGKARLLLQDIEKKRGHHYVDDFILARIQLLEQNKEGAISSFHRLINNIKRYGAMNRLRFELQFAKEMHPTDIFLLMNGIKNKTTNINLNTTNETAELSNLKKQDDHLLIGSSVSINNIKNLVKKFSILKEPVLVTGETGTGKELIARAIHNEGKFKHEPFLAINCGALTESLLQSELFGYVAGAFTGAQKEKKGIFEAAGKGTVFLDEFGEISPKMQVSLLRLLESNEIRLIGGTKTRQIECKIVVATNVELQKAVEEKKFREDLYFRLTRFDIKLPPLRQRREDIPILINHFLQKNGNKMGKHQQFSNNLMEILIKYQWPGNIRELKNEIERISILHPDKQILDIEDFDFGRLQGMASFAPKKENLPISIPLKKEKPKSNQLNINPEKIQKIIQRKPKFEEREIAFKELFQRYKKLSRSQLIEILKINPGSATKSLQNLCKIGYINKIMPTKSVKSHYFVLVESSQ